VRAGEIENLSFPFLESWRDQSESHVEVLAQGVFRDQNLIRGRTYAAS
jgi:hypothetical protein